MSSIKVDKGTILIAEPYMMDPNFKRSVVLICAQEEQGTTGFVINKPVQARVDQMLEDFPECNAPVLMGGPVSTDTLHYLHNVGDLLDDSVEVCPGVYWGGDFQKLKFLIENKLIQDHNIRFFVGYAGWSEGQLDEELEEGSWVTSMMDSNYLFKTKPFVMWQKTLFDKGDRYTVIAQISEEAQLN